MSTSDGPKATGMLLFVGEEVCDYYLASLLPLLRLVDTARTALDEALALDPAEFRYEQGDDLAGFGFVACQRYITGIAAEGGVEKATALSAGPRTAKGLTLVSLVNAAANGWKHESEWGEPLTNQQTRTVVRLDDELDGNAWEYKYVNALYAAVPSSSFVELADGLVAWREELLKQGGRPR